MGRAARRLNVSRAVRMLIRDVARRLPEFRHVKAERIIVVAGEARRASRATVRPLKPAKTPPQRRPKVTFRGHAVLYVITLRPLFFRESTPEERVETILHELFHLSTRFDGTLAPDRRHTALPGAAFRRAFQPLVQRYLADCPPELVAPFATNGEVVVRQWLERPSGAYRTGQRGRRRYSEAQTFLGPVRMITRRTRH